MKKLHWPIPALGILCFIVAALSPAVLHAKNAFNNGQKFFAAHHYDEAYEAFFKAFLDDPGNPEINFLMGRAAYERSDFEAAIMAFDRVLIVHPDAMRVKLELARCHFALGAFESARRHLLDVLEANPPQTVQDNIKLMLAAIRKKNRQHFFHGMAALGFSHDDNVRVAPADETIRVFFSGGFLDTIAARPASDSIFSNTVLLAHTYKPEWQHDIRWKTTMLHYSATYQFEDDLDTRYLSLASGPSWFFSDSTLDIHPVINQLYLEHERYLRAVGMEGAYSFFLGSNVMVQLGAKMEDKRYFQDHDRDAFTSTFRMSEILSCGTNRLQINASAELENARNSIYAYNRYESSLRLEHDFPLAVSGWVSGGLSGSKYKGTNPLFLVARRDRIWNAATGIRKTVWSNEERSLSAEASYAYSNVNSTIDLYTYDKNVFAASLVFSF